MMWCPECYVVGKSDRFHVNELKDDDDNPIYDCEYDKLWFKCATIGAQHTVPFQCDICVFRLLFRRDLTFTIGDYDHLTVLRRMNLDAMWSREPSTIKANLRSLTKLISACSTLGIEPNLPQLGPFPFEDTCFYIFLSSS